MKKVLSVICIILLVLSLAGCSGEASNQKSEEELRAEIKAELEAEAQEKADDSKKTEENNQTDQSANETQNSEKDAAAKDSNKTTTSDSRIEVASFAGGSGFELLIEKDKSKEVVKGVAVYYLSMKYTNGEKKLLAKSIDCGEDWTNSIAEIVYPAMSNDGKKVYYSTDDTFTRTSGYGANNYRTRVVDLKTFEDSYFEEGALVTILNSSHGAYADHVVLELNSLDNAGNPAMVYQVVTPDGEQLVVLENEGNWQTQIDAKLNGNSQDTPQQSTTPSNQGSTKTSADLVITEIPFNGVDKSSLVEVIHGYNVEYSRYYNVIIPDYPPKGGYPFQYGIEFDNPAYSNPDTEYYFAVMGTIHDVRIQSQADMNSDPKLYTVADTIEDAVVVVKSSFPTDFSFDKIYYRDFDGKNYSVTFTDMVQNNKVYAIKLPF